MTENNNSNNDVNNPNDKFFKAAFSRIDITESFLLAFLPKELLDKLDLNTLEIDPNSYINDELKESFSDLVWSCRMKGSSEQRKIGFLLEHKSYKPPFPHFQVMDYQKSSWQMQIAAKQKPVPIIPIIFYHGLDKWKYEPLDSYFGHVEAETLRFLPCFDYILVNLQDFTDEQINSLNSIFLRKTLLSFKHYLDKNYLQLHIVDLLFGDMGAQKNEKNSSFIRIIAVYLTTISGITREEVIEKAKNESNNKINSNAMSVVEEIMEISFEKGIEKGIEKSIINLYIKGLSAETISDYMDEPLSKVKQIITDYILQQNEQ